MVHQEIERKFLLESLPDGLGNGAFISQGYLSIKNPETRVRKIIDKDSEKFFITNKSGEGISRQENEEEITKNVFNILWSLTVNLRVYKTRFKIEVSDGLVWEIDEYKGENEGLFIAEVEIPDIDTEIKIPDSIDEVLEKEVTNDKNYKNKRLAL